MANLDRIEALRNRRAELAAKKTAAEEAQEKSRQELLALGWDGKQELDEFVKGLEEEANKAGAELESALADAEKLAKEFA